MIENSAQHSFLTLIQESGDETADNSINTKRKSRSVNNYRFNRYNLNQLGMMVDFMTLNPSLIRRRVSSKFTKEDREKKWEELAALLNSDEQGVKKTPLKWNKCWNDIKSTLKNRAEKLKQSKAVPNDRKPGIPVQELNDLEMKILMMIGFLKNNSSCTDGPEVISDISDASSYESDSESSSQDRTKDKIVLIHRSDPCSSEDDSVIFGPDGANRLFDTIRENSELSQSKKRKTSSHVVTKRGDKLVNLLQTQNRLLFRIAESVEGIKETLQNVKELSQSCDKRSRQLINVASNIEQLAESFVVSSMTLKEFGRK